MEQATMKKHFNQTREVILALAHYVTGDTLDAGGGPRAKYREILEPHASHYECLDMQSGGNVSVVGDVMSMPLESERFDTVVSNQVIEHIPRPAAFASEAFRVLKPGGIIICTAPFWEPIHSDPSDYFRFTTDGLRSLFQEAGFTIIESNPYGGLFAVTYSAMKFKYFDPYEKTSPMRRRLSRFFEKLFLALDRRMKIGRIYGDSYVVGQKPLTEDSH